MSGLTGYLASRASQKKPVEQKRRNPAEQLQVHDLVVKHVRENKDAGLAKHIGAMNVARILA